MYTPDSRHRSTPPKRMSGFTLIEIILFMVIVGIALGALSSVLGSALKGGADMVSEKQALAIAEAIIEEIALKPFTYCDPDDPKAATATEAAVSASGCTSAATIEGIGPEGGEARANFDNVSDYAGFSFGNPITDHSGLHSFPAGFTVSALTVAGEVLDGIPAAQSLHIQVTVSGPGDTHVTLDTYRTRYAPNFVN